MSFKWIIVRRVVQVFVIALIASPLFGQSFFQGNLSSGQLLGLGLTDPLAFFQATLASRVCVASFLGGALLVTACYVILGGRTFCGWVCPVYLVTEIGDGLRLRLGTGQRTYPLAGVRVSCAITLGISLVAGIPAFEVLSPIGIGTRAIMDVLATLVNEGHLGTKPETKLPPPPYWPGSSNLTSPLPSIRIRKWMPGSPAAPNNLTTSLWHSRRPMSAILPSHRRPPPPP